MTSSLSNYITTTNANALNSTFVYNDWNIHGNISNFNYVWQFGYNFIMETTNGPGVDDTGQYYPWNIGLGSNYAFETYGAQFALPSNAEKPYLCVRYTKIQHIVLGIN